MASKADEHLLMSPSPLQPTVIPGPSREVVWESQGIERPRTVLGMEPGIHIHRYAQSFCLFFIFGGGGLWVVNAFLILS